MSIGERPQKNADEEGKGSPVTNNFLHLTETRRSCGGVAIQVFLLCILHVIMCKFVCQLKNSPSRHPSPSQPPASTNNVIITD